MSGASEGYFHPPRPRIFAHRGLAMSAPENTLGAFAAAVQAGSVYLETDVHASQDGIAVISHDNDLSRLIGRTTRVDQLTLRELEDIDLGGGHGFCSLATALQRFPAAYFNIDIKSSDAAADAARAIRNAGATGRVLVTSFSDRRRRAAVRLLPEVATSAAAIPFAIAHSLISIGLTAAAGRVLSGVAAVQIPELWKIGPLTWRVVTARVVAEFHRLGIEVHVWTVNDEHDMTRLLHLGVDGLVTDRADVALSLIAREFPNKEGKPSLPLHPIRANPHASGNEQ